LKPQPLIAVKDVSASSRWYQKLLGCTSGHGGDEYEQLFDPATAEMILQLHRWGDHDHPNLGDADFAPHGYGVLLWFATDDFAGAVKRATTLAKAGHAEIIEERRFNPNAGHYECWLRDPDGYIVVIAGS
jgi:catechol 2,3-dioxygenase-like lactoylglutathione lyase family enzyme